MLASVVLKIDPVYFYIRWAFEQRFGIVDVSLPPCQQSQVVSIPTIVLDETKDAKKCYFRMARAARHACQKDSLSPFVNTFGIIISSTPSLRFPYSLDFYLVFNP